MNFETDDATNDEYYDQQEMQRIVVASARSATIGDTLPDAHEQESACVFCLGKSSWMLEMMATRLHSMYFDAFNFYFAKSINEILANLTNSHVILFKDYLFLDDDSEYLKRIYQRDELKPRITLLTDFYMTQYRPTYPNLCTVSQNKIIAKRNYKHIKLFNANQERVFNQQQQQEQDPQQKQMLDDDIEDDKKNNKSVENESDEPEQNRQNMLQALDSNYDSQVNPILTNNSQDEDEDNTDQENNPGRINANQNGQYSFMREFERQEQMECSFESKEHDIYHPSFSSAPSTHSRRGSPGQYQWQQPSPKAVQQFQDDIFICNPNLNIRVKNTGGALATAFNTNQALIGSTNQNGKISQSSQLLLSQLQQRNPAEASTSSYSRNGASVSGYATPRQQQYLYDDLHDLESMLPDHLKMYVTNDFIGDSSRHIGVNHSAVDDLQNILVKQNYQKERQSQVLALLQISQSQLQFKQQQQQHLKNTTNLTNHSSKQPSLIQEGFRNSSSGINQYASISKQAAVPKHESRIADAQAKLMITQNPIDYSAAAAAATKSTKGLMARLPTGLQKQLALNLHDNMELPSQQSHRPSSPDKIIWTDRDFNPRLLAKAAIAAQGSQALLSSYVSSIANRHFTTSKLKDKASMTQKVSGNRTQKKLSQGEQKQQTIGKNSNLEYVRDIILAGSQTDRGVISRIEFEDHQRQQQQQQQQQVVLPNEDAFVSQGKQHYSKPQSIPKELSDKRVAAPSFTPSNPPSSKNINNYTSKRIGSPIQPQQSSQMGTVVPVATAASPSLNDSQKVILSALASSLSLQHSPRNHEGQQQYIQLNQLTSDKVVVPGVSLQQSHYKQSPQIPTKSNKKPIIINHKPAVKQQPQSTAYSSSKWNTSQKPVISTLLTQRNQHQQVQQQVAAITSQTHMPKKASQKLLASPVQSVLNHSNAQKSQSSGGSISNINHFYSTNNTTTTSKHTYTDRLHKSTQPSTTKVPLKTNSIANLKDDRSASLGQQQNNNKPNKINQNRSNQGIEDQDPASPQMVNSTSLKVNTLIQRSNQPITTAVASSSNSSSSQNPNQQPSLLLSPSVSSYQLMGKDSQKLQMQPNTRSAKVFFVQSAHPAGSATARQLSSNTAATSPALVTMPLTSRNAINSAVHHQNKNSRQSHEDEWFATVPIARYQSQTSSPHPIATMIPSVGLSSSQSSAIEESRSYLKNIVGEILIPQSNGSSQQSPTTHKKKQRSQILSQPSSLSKQQINDVPVPFGKKQSQPLIEQQQLNISQLILQQQLPQNHLFQPSPSINGSLNKQENSYGLSVAAAAAKSMKQGITGFMKTDGTTTSSVQQVHSIGLKNGNLTERKFEGADSNMPAPVFASSTGLLTERVSHSAISQTKSMNHNNNYNNQTKHSSSQSYLSKPNPISMSTRSSTAQRSEGCGGYVNGPVVGLSASSSGSKPSSPQLQSHVQAYLKKVNEGTLSTTTYSSTHQQPISAIIINKAKSGAK